MILCHVSWVFTQAAHGFVKHRKKKFLPNVWTIPVAAFGATTYLVSAWSNSFMETQVQSVKFSCPVMSNSLWPHGLQQARPPCPSPSPRVGPSSCPLHRWCYPTISSSVSPFSFCPQSYPASGSFPMSRFFTSCGQSIGASASVLPVRIQCWFSLELTGFISLLSKGFSEVFSNTTVQKHQLFYVLNKDNSVEKLCPHQL